MNSKWYLCTLVIILALLGYSQQQVYVPNQEIVIQFSDDAVSFEETQSAIAVVKAQLQGAGIDNIQIRVSEDGHLKITYYSEINVSEIQQLFANQKNIELGSFSFSQDNDSSKIPFENESNGYQLKISELQHNFDTESNFKAHKLELTHENELLHFPVVYISINEIDSEVLSRVDHTAFILQSNIALAIDNDSHNIPEVRAGPAS